MWWTLLVARFFDTYFTINRIISKIVSPLFEPITKWLRSEPFLYRNWSNGAQNPIQITDYLYVEKCVHKIPLTYKIINKVNDIYCCKHLKITYQACQKNTSTPKRGALVDRGANGGLAGADVRVLHVADRQVDVQGIDNHQLTNIPIVTAAGVVDTQKGPVVVILNQYAHVKHGRTIHSAAQMEAHGIKVDDHAIPNGGKQRIIAQSGFVIPLQVRSGLVYMDMRPPTDQELAIPSDRALPQVILTSDLDWHPSSIDYEHDSDQWFDAMTDLPDLESDTPFDDYGEYLDAH